MTDNTTAGVPPEFARPTKDPVQPDPAVTLAGQISMYEDLAAHWKKKRDRAEANLHSVGTVLTKLRQQAANTAEGYP